MKRNLLMAILFVYGSLTVAEVNGQFMDHTFTYQGELVDAGKPANDNYDITIQGYDSQAGGLSTGSLSTHTAVTVENGLFTLDNVDLGAATFDGKQLWLEVNVRKTSAGGSYTALAPRQSLKAVPYAETLTNGSATTGQVLTFDGSQWAPASPSGSLWMGGSPNISYTAGFVGIGVDSPLQPLHVKSPRKDLAIFDGGDDMYLTFKENGVSRGYIGSFQDAFTFGINDEDFEIGTFGSSTGNMHIVTGISNKPRITVTADGKVGINTTTPYADFHIEGTTDGDLVNVRIDGVQKFNVNDNGGTVIGGSALPPENGLWVIGKSRLKGGLAIGDSLSNIPENGLLVRGGAVIGYNFVLPPPDGLLVRGETTLNNNLQVNANVAVTGEINSADSGTADMKAYVYGFANSDGTILTNKSSVGFTSVAKEATGQYKVSFTDTNINNNYIATVTLNSSLPKFATVVDNIDFFRVYVWDKNGDPSDHAFQFVVYRK